MDLTADIADTHAPVEVKIAMKEVVEHSDEAAQGTLLGSYGLHVAIFKYVAPNDLYEE